MTKTECAYCGAVVDDVAVPSSDDNEDWEKIAKQHGETCQWVETRAQPATRRRTLWITDDTWARIEAAARTDERTLSAWVRRVIEAALDEEAG